MTDKDKLRQIEAAISAITGNDIDSSYRWAMDAENADKVQNLLLERCAILNGMFSHTDENKARLQKVNDYLYSLSLQLFERVKKAVQNRTAIMNCPEFDDAYELEGVLYFSFNGPDSVLVLDDDELYQSDFELMIKVLDDLYYVRHENEIERIHSDFGLLDDGKSWNRPPFSDDWFDDTVICHAVYRLCHQKLYSIPDLLRLNDFWNEVNIKIQSIKDQKGESRL